MISMKFFTQYLSWGSIDNVKLLSIQYFVFYILIEATLNPLASKQTIHVFYWSNMFINGRLRVFIDFLILLTLINTKNI